MIFLVILYYVLLIVCIFCLVFSLFDFIKVRINKVDSYRNEKIEVLEDIRDYLEIICIKNGVDEYV